MLTFVMLRWDGSVCRLSVKRVGLARLPNVLLLFVQRNSRKRGPWNYSLTCRPVLTQLLVPKTTVKTVKDLRRLTRRPLPQTQDQVQVSANAARLWIILPHRQK